MTVTANLRAQLSRMEAARRQTQHQLDMIDRQITRKMTAIIPLLGKRRSRVQRGRAPDPGAFLDRYRRNLAALTSERQPEIDALARKLARQDAAITVMQARLVENIDVRRDPPAGCSAIYQSELPR
ncbi:hypothetical protein [Allorhizobium ampelinum]|uniref:hypothetical protein n=1 Tax=Allorhizobium ampelinum TaxID=3025782 RepID=UPI003AA9D055